jgi:hypothetical protein
VSSKRELHLNLAPAYHAHLDRESLVLGRTDGSVVERFSGRGFVAEELERLAWEDYGDDAGGGLCPKAVPLAWVIAIALVVLALFDGRLARPNEGRFD